MNAKQKHVLIIIDIILVIILISTGVGFYTYYNAKHTKKVPEDKASKDRLTVLNNALSSVFGPRWPFILLGLAFVLVLIMVLLYLLTKKEFSLSDSASNALTKSLIAFTIVFTIGIIFFAVKAYIDHKVMVDTGDIPNYIPSDDERKKLYEIFAIAGLSMVILLIIGGIIWHFWRKKQPTKTKIRPNSQPDNKPTKTKIRPNSQPDNKPTKTETSSISQPDNKPTKTETTKVTSIPSSSYKSPKRKKKSSTSTRKRRGLSSISRVGKRSHKYSCKSPS